MEEKLVEKVNETSEKEVGENRRNFLKYVTGAGVVGVGLLGGYLSHKAFRGPSLRERLKRVPKDPKKRFEIITECIHKNPSEVKKYMFATELGSKERYENFNFNLEKEDIINVETAYKQGKYEGYEIDLPDDPKKFSESDKLFIFLYYELASGV